MLNETDLESADRNERGDVREASMTTFCLCEYTAKSFSLSETLDLSGLVGQLRFIRQVLLVSIFYSGTLNTKK